MTNQQIDLTESQFKTIMEMKESSNDEVVIAKFLELEQELINKTKENN